MKILTSISLSICLLFAFGMVAAQETSEGTAATDVAEIVALDEEVTAESLGIQEPTVLPDSPFYFLKNLGRTIQSAVTFNAVKKAELREKFANEKLIELKKVAEKTQNAKAVEKATENYRKEVENVKKATERIKETAQENTRVGQFLDKFIQQQTLHQRILEKLETQVSTTTMAKIQEAREQHLENFGEVMTKLENKENIQERLETNLQKVEGSEFKEFKNLEILKKLEGVVPEDAKEAIQQARENSLIRLKSTVEAIAPQALEDFKTYAETITGNKDNQIEILESLRDELKDKPTISGQIKEATTRILEKVRTEAENINCPVIDKPVANFCENGRVVVGKDENGCVAGFKCITPTAVSPQAPSESTRACVELWSPVCGRDGKTYSNKCFAGIAGVNVSYEGVCKGTECQVNEDCPASRCSTAASTVKSQCVDGRCIVPRCVQAVPLPVEEIKTQVESIKSKATDEIDEAVEEAGNILQKNIIQPLKKLLPTQSTEELKATESPDSSGNVQQVTPVAPLRQTTPQY